MADSIQITTEELIQRTKGWQEITEMIGTAAKRAEELLGALDNCFFSEVIRYFKSAYQKQQEEVLLWQERLNLHIKKLEEIAGIYESAERKNVTELEQS